MKINAIQIVQCRRLLNRGTNAPAAMSFINQAINPKLKPFEIPLPGIGSCNLEYKAPNMAPNIILSTIKIDTPYSTGSGTGAELVTLGR